jgi:hypothetical protein
VCFFGIILFPVYFLFLRGIGFLLGYLVVVGVYGFGFMRYICPVCATRHVCPGGQSSMKLNEMLGSKNNQ